MPPCQTETIEEGRILVITLDRPPDNHVTPEMLDNLAAALDHLEALEGPDLAIVRGSGAVFSKGFDVAVIRELADGESHRRMLLLGNDLCARLAACTKPLLAAINGTCLGAGLELALACHFRLSIEKARLGLPELARGLIPGLGGIHRLVRLIGQSRALEMIVAGRLVSADEALGWGLVNRVLPRENFMDAVVSFARGVLAVDQGLVREVVRLAALAGRRGDQECVLETIDCILRTHREPG